MQNIYRAIDEFSEIPKGKDIFHPNEKINLDKGININRKTLKHVVEERFSDKYPAEKIKKMFSRIPEVVKNPEIKIPNSNLKHKDSLISGKLYPEENQALLVVHSPNGEIREVINAFYRPRRRFQKIRK